MRRAGWATARRRLGRIAALTLLASPAACGNGILNPQGPIGLANRQILFNALEIMLVIVVPTLLAAVAFAWWFRASNSKARYLPEWAYSGRIELIVWSIPILVILFLGGVIWIGSHELDPAVPIQSQNKPLSVQVVSLDWKWLFIYPDQGIASINELVVPAGAPVHFALTSATVMNAFFVPQLGSMIYTMNGMVTQLNLQADRPGDFYGQSSMFSGDGFSGMHFTLRAVTPADFKQWVDGARNTGPGLDQTSYRGLLQQSTNVPPSTFRSVDPQLFQMIATQKLPSGQGPTSGRGGITVHPAPEG